MHSHHSRSIINGIFTLTCFFYVQFRRFFTDWWCLCTDSQFGIAGFGTIHGQSNGGIYLRLHSGQSRHSAFGRIHWCHEFHQKWATGYVSVVHYSCQRVDVRYGGFKLDGVCVIQVPDYIHICSAGLLATTVHVYLLVNFVGCFTVDCELEHLAQMINNWFGSFSFRRYIIFALAFIIKLGWQLHLCLLGFFFYRLHCL